MEIIKYWFSKFWYEEYGFKPFSLEHGFWVALTFIVGWWLIIWGRKLAVSQQRIIGMRIAWVIFGAESFWLFHKIAAHSFDLRYNLPFDLCNVCALAIPLAMSGRYERFTEIMYFWVMTGTLQGILTPDMQSAFPYIGYFKYWAVHSGLVIAVLYAVLVYRIYPTFRGIWWAFGAIQLYAIITYLLNLLFKSNYGYLMHKPENPSLFDYFGEHYIITTQFVCLFLFFLFWLPFAKANKASTPPTKN